MRRAAQHPGNATGGLRRLIPIDPDHPAFFHRQRQLAVLQRDRGLAEQLAAPAVQGGDAAVAPAPP